jgi:hypothetical protein
VARQCEATQQPGSKAIWLHDSGYQRNQKISWSQLRFCQGCNGRQGLRFHEGDALARGWETKGPPELFDADGEGIIHTSRGCATALRRAWGRPILRAAVSALLVDLGRATSEPSCFPPMGLATTAIRKPPRRVDHEQEKCRGCPGVETRWRLSASAYSRAGARCRVFAESVQIARPCSWPPCTLHGLHR